MSFLNEVIDSLVSGDNDGMKTISESIVEMDDGLELISCNRR